MKYSSFKFLLVALFVATGSVGVFAQEDDGIYGDIYESPEAEQELLDNTESPLEGYSTVDDYYPEGGYTSEENTNQPYSEQYVDENGNNITNNYYGDYYEDDNSSDFAYAARINRFHRNNLGWGYYDPFYTNMYWYTYDPFFWGTSINVGLWPNYGFGWNNWGWNRGFGWNNGWNNWGWNGGFGWNNGWGWNGGFGTPACFGGWGGGYWNGYNNGFNDGLAFGGYYNTFDSNSGIYYGHRGSASAGSSGSTLGSGYRNTSFATTYNKAAKEGKVLHANKGNVLQTADARPVKGNLDGYQVQSAETRASVRNQAANGLSGKAPVERTKTEVIRERSQASESVTRNNTYQRGAAERVTSRPQRNTSTVDRSRQRATMNQQRVNPDAFDRNNVYQRGNESTRFSNRQPSTQPSRSSTIQRGNVYRDLQRTQPQQGSRSNQYTRPSNNQRNTIQQPSRGSSIPSRNYRQPSRNTTPSRNATPSRNYQQPSRSVSPPARSQPSRSVSPSPSRGSNRSYSAPTPSRSSGSFGGSRGSSSSPSRGSSSPSRGGRP